MSGGRMRWNRRSILQGVQACRKRRQLIGQIFQIGLRCCNVLGNLIHLPGGLQLERLKIL